MQSSRVIPPSLAVFALALTTALSGALAEPAGQFEPRVGQAGKDVIWVPTPQSLVDKMLEAAKVTPQDFVVDLGSGDGRTVISAARLGAAALGIEYNPDMVELSKRNAAKAGVAGKATFMKADIFATAWPLVVDQTEALLIASRTVGFAVGHASAQLAWRGLRSRPAWRILLYSADDPPTMRGLVELDAVDGHVLGEYTEPNPEDWSKYGLGETAGQAP